MTAAVTFALFSLAAAGCLDVSFKRFSRKARSRGVYLAMCGFSWTILQLTYFEIQDIGLVFDRVTITYGVVAGIVLAVANLVLIESLTHLNVSLGSTIYRLNTIGVVLLSVLVLGESIGLFKALGVACGIVAVWMLYDRRGADADLPPLAIFVWLVIVASALRAIFGIIAKLGLVAGADADTALLIYALSWIPAGLVYALLRERRIRLTGPKIAYGAVSGLLLALTANFLIAAIKTGDVSTVVPIANLSFVIALLISVAMGMEKLSPRKIAAITIAGIALYLLAHAS